MARPRSEEKRDTILAAAIELIAEHGLGAATAEIAKVAQVPHGSVFTYFGTKSALLNELYVELKTELSEAILEAMPGDGDVRGQLHHLWVRWTDWGVSNPPKRRTLAQLGVSDQITGTSRKAAAVVAGPAVEIVGRARSSGALRDAPLAYVGALVETMAGTTIDFMIQDSSNAERIRDAGFKALWQALR
ncbi:AcrR family transcriptional regulator [Rhizobium binae]|uniref:AcrR family transcriptional regulator n=1 Tax=Rhizobium binae TaxID=1138190 RepID=A0ABV2MID1_9HYPH|nr:TetR/AcrR family transcriptional regulator [Rhizobium binae]MBX4994772.1 TetR/AcrR family transcriptional regulator [Rhizobium binae]NKL49825.1 TetR family transcriptional regulator [Rhizobium leguminosarum bv. viciae]QSY85304.1 TetR/AcrR family transcriptional regulator [Rhizobium binae]